LSQLSTFNWSRGDGVNAPWRTQDIQAILPAMDNKTRLVEVEILACVVVLATLAFTLMVGHALWKRMVGEST
jgi:hypothetical protein